MHSRLVALQAQLAKMQVGRGGRRWRRGRGSGAQVGGLGKAPLHLSSPSPSHRFARGLCCCVLQADADHTLADVLPLQEQLDAIDTERCAPAHCLSRHLFCLVIEAVLWIILRAFL